MKSIGLASFADWHSDYTPGEWPPWVSDETIRTHLHHLGEKLGVFPRERRLIVSVARERGLLPPVGRDRPGRGGGVEKRSPGG